VVRAERAQPGSLLFDRARLRLDTSANLGEVLAGLPGVGGVRRAASVPEPVVRGLGAERVATTVGGVTLYGACPSRMDPPVSYINAQAVGQALITRGIPSVTLGPPGLGGRVDISLDYERSRREAAEMHAYGVTSYDSRRNGGMVGAGVYGGEGMLDLRVNAQVLRLDDYQSGGDVTVPASHAQASASLSVGLQVDEHHRFQQALLYKRENDVAYPALPMDNINTQFWLYNAKYRYDAPDGGVLKRIVARGGFAVIDHLMTNERKANRGKLEAATPAETRSYAAGLRADLRLQSAWHVRAGVDLLVLTRDATRQRLIKASGRRFADHIWPDTRQLDGGAYLELDYRPNSALSVRIGARGDLVESRARAADDPSLGGLTIREQYVLRYGDDAAETDRVEGLGAAQALVRYRALPWLGLHVGAGLSMRSAGITERYFAFGPAPGGFQVGNPALDAEIKAMVDLGARIRHRWLSARFGAYYFFVKDYILQKEVQRLDVNGDGQEDSVRGFENTDAHFLGFELSARLKLYRGLSLPLALSYVWGRNAGDGRPLPEIPPLTGHAALRYEHVVSPRLDLWLETGVRFAARQGLVDDRFPEDATDAWAALRVELGARFYRKITLRVSLENLLDADYNEHLTRESLLANGALRPGDEVPAPGRGVLLSLMGEI
jgi:iron complex outermembrane receptor protein